MPHGWNITLVTNIIIWCWCYMESFSAVQCPGLELCWNIKAEDFPAWRHQGGGILVVFHKEGHICRYFGVNSHWVEHIKHEFCLWEKIIPSVFWEMGVSECQAGNKVVLGGLNSFFGSICMVVMQSHFLVCCMECVGDEATNM